MAVQTTTKESYSRLNIRLKTKSKDRISKAAYLLGQDLTEFSEAILIEKACEVIDKYERFELTEAEKNDVFAVLDAPVRKPTAKSLKATKKYKEMIKKGQLHV